MPLTYGDLDNLLGERHPNVRFTMVFEDGERLTGCSHEDPDATDEEIIEACNRTNPKRWGKVVVIENRRPGWHWGGSDEEKRKR